MPSLAFGDSMRRRDLVKVVIGSAAAFACAARAQQPDHMRRIGLLTNVALDDQDNNARIAGFQQRLKQLGWTDGHNVRIDYRFAGGNLENFPKYAAELVALAPDVIVASGNALSAMLQATRMVPVVFAFAVDPVGSGYVESLARPGGNATGFMAWEFSIAGKWLELLKQIAPGVTRPLQPLGRTGENDPTETSGRQFCCNAQAYSDVLCARACIQLRRIVTAANCTPARKFLASLS